MEWTTSDLYYVEVVFAHPEPVYANLNNLKEGSKTGIEQKTDFVSQAYN